MTDEKRPLSEEFVKRSVIQWLSADDWGKNLTFGGLRDKGVDIKVRHNKYPRYFLVEVKGEGNAKVPSAQREVNFNYALGQIVTRMKTEGKRGYKYRYKYGLGFPTSFKKLVLRRLPYDICDKLNLHLFFVDAKGQLDFYDWKRLKDEQIES